MFPCGQFRGFGLTTHRQVAAEFTGGRPAVDGTQRLSIHQQDALIPFTDGWEEALRHHRKTLLLGHQFQQSFQPRGLRRHADHTETGATAQGLEHDFVVRFCKSTELLNATRHQRGSHPAAEAQGTELFVPAAQRIGAIEHTHPGALRHIQQMGGVEIRLIHRRVFAHPDHLEGGQRKTFALTDADPWIRLNR